MRGRNILSRSVLRIPLAGMAAWLSLGVGKPCAVGPGVETRAWPVASDAGEISDCSYGDWGSFTCLLETRGC